jgi:hypothetical protein
LGRFELAQIQAVKTGILLSQFNFSPDDFQHLLDARRLSRQDRIFVPLVDMMRHRADLRVMGRIIPPSTQRFAIPFHLLVAIIHNSDIIPHLAKIFCSFYEITVDDLEADTQIARLRGQSLAQDSIAGDDRAFHQCQVDRDQVIIR